MKREHYLSPVQCLNQTFLLRAFLVLGLMSGFMQARSDTRESSELSSSDCMPDSESCPQFTCYDRDVTDGDDVDSEKKSTSEWSERRKRWHDFFVCEGWIIQNWYIPGKVTREVLDNYRELARITGNTDLATASDYELSPYFARKADQFILLH